MATRAASALVIAVALMSQGGAACTCEGNEQGFHVAPAGGDLRFAPVARQAYESEHRQACAALGGSAGGLERGPYLQLVTQSQAKVVWTSTKSDFAVELRRPDGSVSLVQASPDDSATPAEGSQYVANIDALQSNTIYCYAVLRGDQIAYQAAFRTAPEPDATIQFSAMGDVGKASGDQLAVLEQLKTVRSDLLLITGDVGYDSGTLAQYEAYFFAVYRDLLSLVPVFPASGNHDYETESAAAFRQVFVLPENGGSGGLERWYSFDWGPVHFVVLDTQARLEEQALWLQRDLEGTERSWTVVSLHKPPYASGHHGPDEAVASVLVPVMVEQDVDLVLAGHEHHYERTGPIDGVSYVITGGGGRGTRAVGSSSYNGFTARVAHFVNVEVTPSTLTLHAIDASGQEFDSMQLTR